MSRAPGLRPDGGNDRDQTVLELPGYKVHELAFSGRNSRVYRGVRDADSQPVILKVLDREYPSAEEVARFRHEYALTRRLPADAVAQALDLVAHGNTLILVMEDFGGTSLAELLTDRRLPLEQALRLFVRLVRRLDAIHREGVIHKDVNPANVVWNSQTDVLKLIDFGVSAEVDGETGSGAGPMAGNVNYIAPEQTGRMNRPVDYRSDYYSLGVLFYEVLSGHLPFEGAQALELVHRHIAVSPPPLDSLDPSISEPIARIVDKLLAKSADERYQSAEGLIFDLEKCQRRFAEKGVIPLFPLARNDVPTVLRLPQKLYGRETQVETLLRAFAASAGGHPEVVLVAGYAGVGKSALVQEVRGTVAAQGGFFIVGKFDQFQRSIPYAGFAEAFEHLARQLLSNDEAELKALLPQLQAAVGDDGRVLVEIAPHLGAILGPQSDLPPLEPQDAQKRVARVFRKFVSALAGEERPLVFFLDDLHWADGASLRLLADIAGDPSIRHSLILGAYRDNEVDGAHPLMATIRSLREAGRVVRTVTLGGLAREDIALMLADALRCGHDDAAALAGLLYRKTLGNPFFVGQFLRTLCDAGLLRYDGMGRCWRWDLAAIEQQEFTDNVVDFMADRVRALPPDTIEALESAAILGNIFDLQTVSLVLDRAPEKVSELLWPAVRDGLLVPLDDAYQYVGPGTDPTMVRYRFLHDRVQQAAASVTDELDAPRLHLAAGRLLRDSVDNPSESERLFEIVDHLNRRARLDHRGCRAHSTDRIESRRRGACPRIRRLRHRAAFPEEGLDLLPEKAWEQCYGVTLALHHAAAGAAYSTARFDELGAFIAEIMAHGRDILDRVPAYHLKILVADPSSRCRRQRQHGLGGLGPVGYEAPSESGDGAGYLGISAYADRIGRQAAPGSGGVAPHGGPAGQCRDGTRRRLAGPRLSFAPHAVACCWSSARSRFHCATAITWIPARRICPTHRSWADGWVSATPPGRLRRLRWT